MKKTTLINTIQTQLCNIVNTVLGKHCHIFYNYSIILDMSHFF